MNTKLKLSTDDKIIDNANESEREHSISPLVKKLSGVLKPDNVDCKKEYSDYISKKYR